MLSPSLHDEYENLLLMYYHLKEAGNHGEGIDSTPSIYCFLNTGTENVITIFGE